MKYRYTILIFFIAFLLQATLLNVIGVFHATPNLILCLLIAFSFLYEGQYCSVVLGVCFGILMDVCYAQYTGVAALGYLIVGIGVILTKEILNKENVASILIVTAAATLFYNLYYWAVMYLLGSGYGIIYVLKQQPVYIIYNMLIVAILYRLLIKRVVKYHFDRYYK